MDRRDDLALLVTEKIDSFSAGIDEKINNAALQAKITVDLSNAIRTHLQKIADIADSPADPPTVLATVKSAIQNLAGALLNEEGRVRSNHESLVTRKHVLAEVAAAVDFEISSHRAWLQKRDEIQQRALAGDDPSATKTGQRPESIRNIKNALERSPESGRTLLLDSAPRPVQEPIELVDASDDPGASQGSQGISSNGAPSKDSSEVRDPPTHVSRFF